MARFAEGSTLPAGGDAEGMPIFSRQKGQNTCVPCHAGSMARRPSQQGQAKVDVMRTLPAAFMRFADPVSYTIHAPQRVLPAYEKGILL